MSDIDDYIVPPALGDDSGIAGVRPSAVGALYFQGDLMTKLPTAILGRTGLEVTRLGYGAGHRKPMTEKQNQAMVRRVVRLRDQPDRHRQRLREQ